MTLPARSATTTQSLVSIAVRLSGLDCDERRMRFYVDYEKAVARQIAYQPPPRERTPDLARRRRERDAGRSKPRACEVCGDDQSTICFDHDHTSGLFRGWLCAGCNIALGQVNDSPVRLRKLADYLERFVASRTSGGRAVN